MPAFRVGTSRPTRTSLYPQHTLVWLDCALYIDSATKGFPGRSLRHPGDLQRHKDTEKCKQCAAVPSIARYNKARKRRNRLPGFTAGTRPGRFRGSRRVWSLPLEATIAPFCASSEDKEQVPTAHGIRGPGGVCFSFPLASTCNVQADSLYLCWRRATSLFALYFALMTNKTM